MTVLDYQPSDSQPRSPLRELLSLAIPTVIQMASYTLMTFIDTLMLAKVGDLAATAAGSAGMFAWTLLSFGIGTLFLVNTLASQSFGRRDLPEAGRYLWQGILLSILYTPIVVALTLALPCAFSRMGHSPQLLAAENQYLRVIIVACPFKLIASALGQFLIAVNRPAAVTIAATTGVAANILAAFALVLGHFGCPAMGVAGGAWAQTIGLAIEMLILAYIAWTPAIRLPCRLADCRLYAHELWTLVRVGVPSGFQVIAEMLAWSLFMSWVVAGLGVAAMAASIYVFRFMLVSFMPAIGIGSAVTALVGRYIGRGDPRAGAHRAHLGFGVAAIYMVACGILFFVFRDQLMYVFTHDAAVLRVGRTLLIYAAFYQLFDAMYAVYNGALRGAGDTTIPAIAMAALCWALNVLAGRYVVRTHPEWGIHGPWSMAMAYGIGIGLFLLIRFSLGRWQAIHLDAEPEASKLPAFPLEAEEN
jgi:MATE family multidrug resistance protein